MIIPTFVNVQFTEKDGYLTSAMQMYNDELNNVLRNGLSDNGWTIPIITSANLAKLEALPAFDQMPNGTIWMVRDEAPLPVLNELVVKIDGALRKVTTTAYP